MSEAVFTPHYRQNREQTKRNNARVEKTFLTIAAVHDPCDKPNQLFNSLFLNYYAIKYRSVPFLPRSLQCH